MVTSDGPGAADGITPGAVRSGIAWITGISVLRDGLQFGVTLVLVRLLDGKAYGEFSLVSAILAFFSVLSFRSFLEYSIQARPGQAVDYQSHFTFSCYTQILAALAMNAGALVLRRFPDYAPVAPVLSVMSIFVLFDGAGELRVKMLERALNWKRLRTLEAAGLLASAATAIGMALSGAGVYALLIPGVVATVPFAYDLLVTEGWRPAWKFDQDGFRPAWRYGVTRLASGLTARGQQLLESGSMAAVIGLPALGVYGRAVSLASFACLKLTSVMTLAIFPMLTRYERGSASFRQASALLLRAVAWSSIPAAALLSLAAAPLIGMLYGSKWAATIPLLPWAMAAASALALSETAAFLLLASVEPGRTLAIDVINLSGTAICLVFLLPHGIVPYMEGLLAVQAAAMLLGLGWLTGNGVLSAAAIRSAFGLPLVSVGCLAAVVLILKRFGSPPYAGPIGIAFVLLYPACARMFAGPELRELLEYVPGSGRARRLLRLR